MNVACIGAGLVGSSWASVFARAGHIVSVFDIASSEATDRALTTIRATLVLLEDNGFLTEDIPQIMARIKVAETLEQVVGDADYVQESVREDLLVKQNLYAQLEPLITPTCVLGSSTSALKGSEFFNALKSPNRALVVHPVNPPALIPLVELCPTEWTDPDVLQQVESLMLELAMKPIIVRKEIDGFILNRLQYTLVAEAMHLIGEGYCTADDIDRVMTDGLALRWASIGPFQVAHLNAAGGFKGFVDQLGPMMKSMGALARTDYDWDSKLADQVHEQMSAHVPIEAIPARQAWRDAQILKTRQQQKAAKKPN